jgi:hypothetical protein
MFWGELKVVSSRGASPAREATEEIAAAATCHQTRRFVPAGFSLVVAALRGGPVGFDGAGFVPTSFDTFGAVNRDAHRCSTRLWM